MVRKNRKKKGVTARQLLPDPDLPVANFVDSSEKRIRVRKSDLGYFKAVMAQTVHKADDDIPDDWFDRDEEDLVSEETKTVINTAVELKPEIKIYTSEKYRMYPIDFWHLLSNYIKPEQVGSFALICRQSNAVVCSQSFWRKLYQDYFDPVSHGDLPTRLLPDSMSRPKGLIAGVIKMLHMTYQPFLERQTRQSQAWPDPHCLTGNLCTLNWSTKVAKKTVYYYFKFKDSLLQSPRHKHNDTMEEMDSDEEYSIGDSQQTKQLLDDLSDIRYNTEEGCKTLQVTAASWSAIPPVLGQKLLGVTLSVSHGMRFHKLKLLFGSPLTDCRRQAAQEEVAEVVIDSVCGMKVLNWWSPQYLSGGEGIRIKHNIDHFGV